MIMDVQVVAHVAVGAAWALGGALTLAVLGAMWEAAWPGAQARLWACTVWALSVALRGLVVAWVWSVLTYRRYRRTGNRRWVARGEHRPQVAVRRRAGGTYNVRALTSKITDLGKSDISGIPVMS